MSEGALLSKLVILEKIWIKVAVMYSGIHAVFDDATYLVSIFAGTVHFPGFAHLGSKLMHIGC